MALKTPTEGDDGKIKLPRVGPGMNRIAPKITRVEKNIPLGQDDSPEGKQKADDQKLLSRIRKRFTYAIGCETENRQAALNDLKFESGEQQWDASVVAQRNFDNRPCLTINKIPTFVHWITNDLRQNRPAINISPIGDRGDPEAAKMYMGMIRAIERECHADIAYDTATHNAVANGFGFFRLMTEWDGPDTFSQVIVIKRIRNPFTVYLDPNAQEPEGADARWGFVTENMPRDEFEDMYPGADPMSFNQQGVGEKLAEWISEKTIRVAEYFELKNENRTLVALSNGFTGWKDGLSDEVKDQIASGKLEIEQERESAETTCMWYKVTAVEVLEEKRIPGHFIPIVRIVGDEYDIEGKVKYQGVIRNAKDPQRLYNYLATTEIELVMLQPKAPWVMEEGQIEGHEDEWQQANVKQFSVLQYKGTNINGTPAPPPQRQAFAGSPEGVVNAKVAAAQDMMATTGIRFDSTMNERLMDESGKAIKELKASSELGSFHYGDNVARALRHAGRIMIDWIPEIYDTKRTLVILREDDSEEKIQIDPNAQKPYQEVTQQMGAGQSPKKTKIFNPTIGKYGITVTIGPNAATKRIEATQGMLTFATAFPHSAPMIADLVAKNQDWPGAAEIATRLAKALPPQLLTPDQKDIPPQVQAVMQAMDMQIKQLVQQLTVAMQKLHDKSGDQQIKIQKAQQDFEAKMAAIVQKAESSYNKDVGTHLKQLGDHVKTLHEAITSPPKVAEDN